MTAHLIADLYPADLTLAMISPESSEPTSTRYPVVRAVLTDAYITVWHRPDNGIPEVLLRAPVLEWSHDLRGGRRAPYRVATAEAEPRVLSLTKTGGCGCGNPLKRVDVRWALQDEEVPA